MTVSRLTAGRVFQMVCRTWPCGRLLAISFHSGEDGVVKRFLANGARGGDWDLVTRRPVEATPDEVRSNPRSRSAKLRVGERLSQHGDRA